MAKKLSGTSKKPVIIMCDDVRMELNNKASLMGVYASELKLRGKGTPARIQKLCVFSVFKDLDAQSVTIYFKLPDSEEEGSHFMDVPQGSRDLNFILEFIPFEVHKTGKLKIWYKLDNGEKLFGEEFDIIIEKED